MPSGRQLTFGLLIVIVSSMACTIIPVATVIMLIKYFDTLTLPQVWLLVLVLISGQLPWIARHIFKG